jgi:Cu-Zn family superoxide dismutase
LENAVDRTLPIALVALLVAAPLPAQEAPRSMVVEIANLTGQSVGVALLVDGPAGVLVRAELRGLPAGEHGFHVHETGACEPPFESAGGHLAEESTSHGFLSETGMHAGDLPNFHVSTAGEARFDAFVPGVRLDGGVPALLDADGSALVIHAMPDDYLSHPAGEAGTRIACGRITG